MSVDVAIGDTVGVHLPYRNGAGELETRTVHGEVVAVTGGAMDPRWVRVLVTDGIEGEPVQIEANADRGRVRVTERAPDRDPSEVRW